MWVKELMFILVPAKLHFLMQTDLHWGLLLLLVRIGCFQSFIKIKWQHLVVKEPGFFCSPYDSVCVDIKGKKSMLSCCLVLTLNQKPHQGAKLIHTAECSFDGVPECKEVCTVFTKAKLLRLSSLISVVT